MGCFSVFSCFTNQKLIKSVNSTTSSSSVYQGYEKDHESVLIKVPTEESTNLGSLETPFSKSRDITEDLLINGSDSKTVVIDLDVDTNEHISIEEKHVKGDSGKLGFLVQIENEKEKENEEKKEKENEEKKENGKLGVLVQVENEKEKKNELKEEGEDFGVQVEMENEKKIESDLKEENRSLGVRIELENEKEVQSQAAFDSSDSSYISYPPMHRYHNYVINEDDDEDVDQDENHHVLIQEESSESLFSLSIDPRKQSKSCPEEDDDKEVISPLKISYSPELVEVNEVNTPLKVGSSPELIAKSIRYCADGNDHNQKIDSLLNPIENLAQWKTLKTRPIPTLDHHKEKENCFLEEETPTLLSEEPISKVPDRKGKLKTDTAVTTSLSSWLVEPEKSTTVSKEESQSQYSTGNSYSYSAYSDGATSWKSFEDSPILGAWTIDEVRQISARSSPRKSPSHNPDETPIIGSVGSYWNHTGQATYSSNSYTSPIGVSAKSRKNRENKAINCHSSPSKKRLERAFNKTAA